MLSAERPPRFRVRNDLRVALLMGCSFVRDNYHGQFEVADAFAMQPLVAKHSSDGITDRNT
jgi:hypothetical protein